jgi:hypothetical protein
MRLRGLFGKGVRPEPDATPATTVASEMARMEHAIATLAKLQEELVALLPETKPPGQAAGDPVDLLLGKPIGEMAGNLVSQAIDEPTGQRVSEAAHKPVDDALARSPPTRRDGLFVMKVGESIRLSHGPLREEPPAEAIAKHLLAWFGAEFPASAGRWVAYTDLRDHVYPRFQAETGIRRTLGSVLRGLNKVTEVRSRDYTDHESGKRKTLKEYLVPDSALLW